MKHFVIYDNIKCEKKQNFVDESDLLHSVG